MAESRVYRPFLEVMIRLWADRADGCRRTSVGGSGKNFVDGDQGETLAIGMQVSGHPLLV
jgi:hypothetical protein